MGKLASACLAGLWLATCAPADELRLKGGTKISGTIVGFEDNHFKVRTSYGYALVHRDQVRDILITEPATTAPAKAPPAPTKPQQEPPTVAAAETPPPARAAPASNAPSPQPPVPEPPISEEVQGTTYVNHTYGFQLYKPPSWQVIEGASQRIPNAVAALGTSDETTLLIVRREKLEGPLEAHAARAEQALRSLYENYRMLGESRPTVASLAAIERRFRCTVDNHDWSGRMLWLARGSEVFTLLGMTHADSELIQIQENVIARVLASLQFAKP